MYPTVGHAAPGTDVRMSSSRTGSFNEPGVLGFGKASCLMSPRDPFAHTPTYAPFPPSRIFDPAGYRASLMFFRVDPYVLLVGLFEIGSHDVFLNGLELTM
jgi:hypothetical protein